ncbi:MAG: sigma 54-interacting transcriptional regulator [Planctomycetota bacterium]
MSKDYRGGNSRQLAKSLDQIDKPMAILDRKGQFIFLNSPLCQHCDVEATQLVGKQTSWEVASDSSPIATILTSFAPPSSARDGKLTLRRLTTPITFGSEATGQLFLPILGEDHLVDMCIVLLGKWEEFHAQFPDASVSPSAEAERALADLRSRWPKLDGLHALLGESSSMELAMGRAELATQAEENLLMHGPAGVGKVDVSRAIFSARLERNGLNPVAGQYFPIECAALDAELTEGMLEVFQGRLSPEQPRMAQTLVLENLDQATDASVDLLLRFLQAPPDNYCVFATSRSSPQDLRGRAKRWQEIVQTLCVHEIELPSLAERREDIAVLAQQFLAESCRKAERAMLTLSGEALDLLGAFSWPRNVKQLEESIQSAVQHAVLTKSIQVSHLPVEIRSFSGSVVSGASQKVEAIELDAVLLDLERIILRRALRLSPRNRAQVARWLDISRPRLLRRIEQLGLGEDKSSNDNDSA